MRLCKTLLLSLAFGTTLLACESDDDAQRDTGSGHDVVDVVDDVGVQDATQHDVARDVANDAADATRGADADVGGPQDTWNRWIRDEHGRVVILRGTNVGQGSKHSEDQLPPEGAAAYERLRDEVGLNAVRFLVFWEAIEPARGEYDMAYLEAVKREIERATAAGLLVMVDMHQDIFGRGFGHAGAPRWACDEEVYAAYSPPPNWYEGYFTTEVRTCFDRLWADVALQDSLAQSWAQVARLLADVDGVFAYDLFNEPFLGSYGIREFEEQVLPAFYARIIAAIRVEDPHTMIALEPAPSANLGLPTNLVMPPGEGMIYAPHAYIIDQEIGEPYEGDPLRLRRLISRQAADAEHFLRPLIVGEFGVAREVEGAEQFMSDMLDVLDEFMTSAFQWDATPGPANGYGLWDTDGESTALAHALARPYLERVPGEPLEWSWDAATGVFAATWREDDDATAPTWISLPALAFPAGLTWELDDDTARVEAHRLIVEPVGGVRSIVLRAGDRG